MRRRSVLYALLILCLAGVAVVGTLALLVKQEPAFYTADPGDGATDVEVASAVLTRFGDLMNDVRLQPKWSGSFTATELNAFLRENLREDGWLARVLPPELTDPRVAIDGDRVKVAGRVGDGIWSTVVSAELRVWLVKDEVNTVAVELVGMRAGVLPVELQWFRGLDAIAEAVQDRNVDVSWYRHDGHLVGVFRLYADQPRPPTQLQTVMVADGRVTVAGRSMVDTGAPRSVLPGKE
ncbi:MAG TPA: hypothetical protein VM533_12150 [Fimbriiglobus sp.]|nr:hypothetical protein [Fimbriiglobus sp.]